MALLTTNCRTVRVVAQSEVKSDTVIVVETLRDTLIRVDADSSMIQALIECDSLGRTHLKQLVSYQAGDRLKPPEITIKDNIITASARVDSLNIYLQLKDRYKEVRKAEIITKVVEVNKLTRWQRFIYTLGCVALGAVVVWCGVVILKKIRL